MVGCKDAAGSSKVKLDDQADFGVPSISVHFPLIHNPWSSATLLPGRRLTGASLFNFFKYISNKFQGNRVNVLLNNS